LPETKYSKTLKVRVESELYEQLKLETERLDTDISKYVRSCIRRRLDGKELNILKKRSKE
jgi:predicted HicB family RNase H-like nuclease